MNWQKEFESFMAQQPDHEGVPVWDRFLWWFHKDVDLDWNFYFRGEYYRFISGAFIWKDTDEGLQFWSDLDTKWRDHVAKIRGGGK